MINADTLLNEPFSPTQKGRTSMGLIMTSLTLWLPSLFPHPCLAETDLLDTTSCKGRLKRLLSINLTSGEVVRTVSKTSDSSFSDNDF